MEKLYYLRNLKNKEIARLENVCKKWNAVSFEDVPEEEFGKILAVIGQAKLLIKEKIAQFNNLLDTYESNTTNKITIEDLEGFWDLVSIQIEDIYNKSNNLEKLQSNAWVPLVKKFNLKKIVNKREPKKTILNREKQEEARRRLAEVKAQFRSNSKDNLDTFFI